MEELSTPITQFARDRLVLGDGYHAPIDAVYRAWRSWCEDEGRDRPGPRSHFSRDLRAAYPQVARGERVYDNQRKRAFLGARLRHTGDDVAEMEGEGEDEDGGAGVEHAHEEEGQDEDDDAT